VNRGAWPVRKTRVSLTLRAWRSPLRRRVDRIEAVVLCALAVLFLTTGPVLAIFAGDVAETAGLRELRADAGSRQVPATLLENASAGRAVSAGAAIAGGGVNVAVVAAKWDSPSGLPHTGLIEVPAGMRASERVTIWVTKAGSLTEPPLSRADLTERVLLTVAGTVLGFAVVLCAAAAGVRAAANRRRMADWGRAWAAISPRSSQSW
jgi:hypothetical protein